MDKLLHIKQVYVLFRLFQSFIFALRVFTISHCWLINIISNFILQLNRPEDFMVRELAAAEEEKAKVVRMSIFC